MCTTNRFSRGLRPALALVTLLACLGPSGAFAQSPSPADQGPLLPNKPAERRLKGGEAHSFALTLSADQYVKGAVEQDGVDVEVTVLDPSGAVVMKVDSPNGTSGPEPFEFLAKAPGEYRVVVAALDPKAAEGGYTAELKEARAVTPGDEHRIAAAALRHEADALSSQASPEPLKAGEAKYREAIDHYAAVGDEVARVETMLTLGENYINQRKHEQAIEIGGEALAIAERLADVRLQAHANLVLGYSMPWVGKPAEGIAKL